MIWFILYCFLFALIVDPNFIIRFCQQQRDRGGMNDNMTNELNPTYQIYDITIA